MIEYEDNKSTTERAVMRRVRTIHIIRPFVSSGALSAGLFLLALWGIGREVWVARVFQNGPPDILGQVSYMLYAFGHTRLVVQVLTLVTFVSAIYLARESARLMSRAVALAHG